LSRCRSRAAITQVRSTQTATAQDIGPALAVLGGGVADVGERPGPGDHREHGDRQRVGDCEQQAARAHQPSRRPARPGRPGGPSPPRPGLARLPLCRGGAAPGNAESFTPGCLLNARPALTLPAATTPPATRGARPGRAGAELPPSTEIRFSMPFFTLGSEISYQRGKISPLLQEVDIPGLYLSWSFGVPAVYLGLPFRRSWPSHGGGLLTVAFHARRGPGGPRAPWPWTRARFRPCREAALAPEASGSAARVGVSNQAASELLRQLRADQDRPPGAARAACLLPPSRAGSGKPAASAWGISARQETFRRSARPGSPPLRHR